MPRTTIDDLTVSYTILANPDGTGPYNGQISEGRREETMSFLIGFADREQFFKEVIGKRTVYGTGTDATIEITEPLQCPLNSGLYARSIDFEALGSDSSVSTTRPYTKLVARITFAALNWLPDDPSQPYISRRIRGSGQFITLPGVPFSFSTGEKLDQDIGKFAGGHVIEVTRHEIPDLNQFLAIAEPLEGYVNSTALTIRGRSYSAGYILFATFSADEENRGLGQTKATASMQFMYRAIKWNQSMRSDGVYDDLTPAPYSTGDLSVLLT